MKKKDMIYALLAVVIMLVAGYVAYTQLLPQKTATTNTVSVEKVGKIPANLDALGMARISDKATVVNYNLAYDLSGVGNQAPFGP